MLSDLVRLRISGSNLSSAPPSDELFTGREATLSRCARRAGFLGGGVGGELTPRSAEDPCVYAASSGS